MAMPEKVSVNAVNIRPHENKIAAITLTIRYPKRRNNGPLIKPIAIERAEFIFKINVISAAGIFNALNLSLKIKPILLVVGIPMNYGRNKKWLVQLLIVILDANY